MILYIVLFCLVLNLSGCVNNFYVITTDDIESIVEEERTPTTCAPLRGEEQPIEDVVRGQAYDVLPTACI